MILYQGNTYNIPCSLTIKGVAITDDNVKKVEFAIGNVIKTYPDTMSYENGKFIIPLTQEDTFSLEGQVNCQIRVMFNDGSVKCGELSNVIVNNSVSKVVLS